jgi:hypothetical protein
MSNGGIYVSIHHIKGRCHCNRVDTYLHIHPLTTSTSAPRYLQPEFLHVSREKPHKTGLMSTPRSLFCVPQHALKLRLKIFHPQSWLLPTTAIRCFATVQTGTKSLPIVWFNGSIPLQRPPDPALGPRQPQDERTVKLGRSMSIASFPFPQPFCFPSLCPLYSTHLRQYKLTCPVQPSAFSNPAFLHSSSRPCRQKFSLRKSHSTSSQAHTRTCPPSPAVLHTSQRCGPARLHGAGYRSLGT